MNELVRRFNNSDLSINLTSILILNNETNEFEPWFIAKEVATLLGYTNASKAIGDHVDELDQKMLSYDECKVLFGQNILVDETLENTDDFRCNDSLSLKNSTYVNPRGMKFINESGLYTLIARSNKPEARKFQRWVTSEVLPSIRKTGSYNVQQQQQTPSYIIEDKIRRATVWIEEQKYALQLEAEKERLALENKTLEAELTEVSEQRDKAIKTKAYINDKRTASLMGKVSGQSKKITKLEGELDTANDNLLAQADKIINLQNTLDRTIANMYTNKRVRELLRSKFDIQYAESTLQQKVGKALKTISNELVEKIVEQETTVGDNKYMKYYYTDKTVMTLIQYMYDNNNYLKRF